MAEGGCCFVWLKVVVLYGSRLLLLFCMAEGGCCFVWLKVVVVFYGSRL